MIKRLLQLLKEFLRKFFNSALQQFTNKQVGPTPKADFKSAPPDRNTTESPVVQDKDYYIDPNGLYVFTSDYLKRRGYCCNNGCRHCPY